ncbi:MAG: ATP-dependent Clp protease adaptor ClpS [Sphingobacteriaceae bacterium]|nr:ATP-dependent Clp protease adaptor ClpS [Sphingobacteriaceae bacterium]
MKKQFEYSRQNGAFEAALPKEWQDQQHDVLVLEEESESLSIVLYNDEVNTFDHVIMCLVKYCEHSVIQAEQCAWITHYKGKCQVKTGGFEQLRPQCEALLEQGLSAFIE